MNFLTRNLYWILGAIVLVGVLYYFSDIVSYILIAAVFSMLGRPILVFYRKHISIGRFRLGPSAAALLTILTFYSMLAGIIMLIVPTLVSQARNLAAVDFQALGDKMRPAFFNFDLQLHQVGILSPDESLAMKTQEALTSWFKPTLVGDYLGAFLGVAGNVAVTFASVTFILFFFLQDSRLFNNILHSMIPDQQKQKVHTAMNESADLLTRYLQGLLMQLVVFSLLATTILWIFGVKNAVLIGSFGGLFNIIPYLGPILGMIFGLFITISSNLEADFALMLPMLLKVAVTFIVVQMIDNNVVGPLIMSKSVQAHPLEIFLVTLAAAKIGGVVGMIIGIPVYTVLRVVARIFLSQFKIVQDLTGRMDEADHMKVGDT
ncbi:MAG: AI-2E family transporter [Saprospiraceae bacterium]|nr:AI-2E family transporter [Saprospiraceae bacterium]